MSVSRRLFWGDPRVIFADRLVLAYLTGDDDATDLIAAEVGECADCWRVIAEALAGKAGRHMCVAWGGVGAATTIAADSIAEQLDAIGQES